MAPPSPYAAPQLPAAADPYAPVAPGQDPYGQNPYGGRPPTRSSRTTRTRTTRTRTATAPYGQAPYGQAYGQPPYGSTAYGQPPYSMPPAPYGAPPAKNTSAIVLTVVSAVTLVACCNLLAIPSLILGIIGINKSGTDPQGAARMTKAGWITFAVTTGAGRDRLGDLLRPGRLRQLRRLHDLRVRGALRAAAGVRTTPERAAASQQTSRQLTGSHVTLAGVSTQTPEARLLVVEDEPNIRELLATSLRYAGFDVATAASGYRGPARRR